MRKLPKSMSRQFFNVLVCIEAAVLFGPAATVLMLGILLLPTWFDLFVRELSGNSVFLMRTGGPLSSMVIVVSCLIGLVGLGYVIVAILQGHFITRLRVPTLLAVTIGVGGIVLFNASLGLVDPREHLAGSMVYQVLPTIGVVHFLFLARHFLFGVNCDSSRA
jgi:hypothetical protein